MFLCCKIVSCLTSTQNFIRLKTLKLNKVLLTEWPIMILWECRGVIFLGVAYNHSLELRQLVFTAIGIIADAFLIILYIFEIAFVSTRSMDPLMGMITNSEEPEWLERRIAGDLRLWQVMFMVVASLASLIVIVCCCFRFRIPRTKQQIEADYQRRKITTKFRAKLETIQDAKMDAMSLKDALDLLHEQTNINMEGENQQGSQPSSIMSPQQSSLDASFQPEGGQKPEQQASGLSFVKFASKVATLSKLGQPKSPTSPTPSGNDNKMDF